MKTLTILLTLTLCSIPAFAGPAPITIPSTAKVLFQAAGGNEALLVSSPESARAQSLDSAMKDIEEKQAEKDTDYLCKGVYRQWSGITVQEFTGTPGGWNRPASNPTYMGSVSVTIYCDPRSFQDKVAISAERACEREPKAECMSQQYLDLFAKIQPTNYYDLGKPRN